MQKQSIDIEFLKSAIENGIIDPSSLAELQEKIDMKKRNKYLAKHTNKIYQGKDGRWFTKAPVVEGGVIVSKRQKAFRSLKEAEDYIVSIYQMIEEDPTIKDIFGIVQNEKLANEEIMPSTYTRNWNDFKRFFPEFGKRQISSIEEYDIEDFLIEQKRKHKLTNKGYSNLTCCLRTIFRYARRKKMISFNIDEVIKNTDLGRNAFRKTEHDEYDDVFTDEEIYKLVNYVKLHTDNIYYLGFLLIFGTGLRIGELSSLKWEDYNGKSLKVTKTETAFIDKDGIYHCEISDHPKTIAGQRKVPIPSTMIWIMDKLKELNPDNEYIFVTYSFVKKKMVRARTDYFRKALLKLCEKVGLPRKTPHKIRKTYASILLDHGVAEKTILENMGHTNLSVTMNNYGRQRRSEEQRQSLVDNIQEFKIAQ